MSGSSIAAMALLFAILIAVWLGARKSRARAGNEGTRRLGLWTGAGSRRDSALLRVVESRRLSSHSVLHVVVYEGRQLMLADSVHGVQCLVDEPTSAAHAARAGAHDAA